MGPLSRGYGIFRNTRLQKLSRIANFYIIIHFFPVKPSSTTIDIYGSYNQRPHVGPSISPRSCPRCSACYNANATRLPKYAMAACCRCNRTGRCQNCACVKGGRACQGCLPQRLGKCVNTAQTQPAPQTDLSQQNSSSRHTLPSPSIAAPPHSPPSRSSPSTEFHSSPELLSSPSPNTTAPAEPSDVAPELPAFPPAAEPIFSWGNLKGPEFTKLLDTTYDEVVHWRRNCFVGVLPVPPYTVV